MRTRSLQPLLLGCALFACSSGSSDSGEFRRATRVIGQPDLTTATYLPASASTVGKVYGKAASAGGRLYLPDWENNRVLGYDALPGVDGEAADFVLGQGGFTGNGPGLGAAAMNGPSAVLASGGKLFVVEFATSRVTIFDTPPTTTQTPASVVVGQSGFDISATGCQQDRLNNPRSAFVVGPRLIVADSMANRVLVWNSIPTTSGAPADLVLGQPDFTHCGMPDAPSATTLFDPSDVWSDGTRLVVTDSASHRVLVWDTFPTVNQQAADRVLGQQDLVSSSAGVGAARLNWPDRVTSDGTRLFVTDAGNNRVLVWSSFPTEDGQAADRVLGQGSMDANACNDDDQDGEEDDGPTARTLCGPSGVSLVGESLIVTDCMNYRFLVFERI